MRKDPSLTRDIALVVATAAIVAIIVAGLIFSGVGRPEVVATPTAVPTPTLGTVIPTNTRSNSILVPQPPTFTPGPTATPRDTPTPPAPTVGATPSPTPAPDEL